MTRSALQMLCLCAICSSCRVTDGYRMKQSQATTAPSPREDEQAHAHASLAERTDREENDKRQKAIDPTSHENPASMASGAAEAFESRISASSSVPMKLAQRMKMEIGRARMQAYEYGYVPIRLLHTMGMAVVCGILHAVAPDHLGTLISLSTTMDSIPAFKVGASWGLGHCGGTILLAVIALLCKKVSNFEQDWEYYGDYGVGLSMIVVGVYFLLRRSVFLDQQSDGTYTLRGCACHGANDHFTQTSKTECASADAICAPCESPELESFGKIGFGSKKKLKHSEDVSASLPKKVDGPRLEAYGGWEERGCAGAVAGFVQGACCPTSLVGITFLAQVQASGIIIFVLCFIATTVVGTGAVAMAWATLLRSSVADWLPPRALYITSCCFSILLGIAWATSNYFGVLKTFEYTEGLEPR